MPWKAKRHRSSSYGSGLHASATERRLLPALRLGHPVDHSAEEARCERGLEAHPELMSSAGEPAAAPCTPIPAPEPPPSTTTRASVAAGSQLERMYTAQEFPQQQQQSTDGPDRAPLGRDGTEAHQHPAQSLQSLEDVETALLAAENLLGQDPGVRWLRWVCMMADELPHAGI